MKKPTFSRPTFVLSSKTAVVILAVQMSNVYCHRSARVAHAITHYALVTPQSLARAPAAFSVETKIEFNGNSRRGNEERSCAISCRTRVTRFLSIRSGSRWEGRGRNNRVPRN